MTSREELLSEVEAFLAHTGMPNTTLGALALRDPSFVANLRAGRNITLRTADRVRTFMRGWKPVRATPKRRGRPPSKACAA